MEQNSGAGVIEWVWRVFSFGVGLFAGHHFALKRTKREEWNNLTEEVFKALKQQANHKGQPIGLHADFRVIETYMSFVTRWRFRRSLERYKKATIDANRPNTTDWGSAPHDPHKLEMLAKAAKRLLRFFKRR